jgi:hypothetical protein
LYGVALDRLKRPRAAGVLWISGEAVRNKGVYRYCVKRWDVWLRKHLRAFFRGGVINVRFDGTPSLAEAIAQETLVEDRGELVRVGLR